VSTIVAFDPGYGNIKLFGDKGQLVMPSAVSVGDKRVVSRMVGLRVSRPPLRVETDSGFFYVGEGAHDWGRPVENLDFDRLTGSPELLALFYGAVARFGLATEQVTLIVGLPIHTLMGDEARSTQQAVRDAFRREHAWKADGQNYCLLVDSVLTTSQPVGTMFDYLLDESGSMSAQRRLVFEGELGVMGIGMNTLDLLVVRNGSPVQRFTAGDTLGVRRLLALADRDAAYSLAELDMQLRAGVLDIAHACPLWQSELFGFIEKRWGSTFRRFSKIVVAGGGASILREPLLRHFREKIHIPDDPIIATARGLYRYTLMRARRTSGG
jgi:hypothetical protein